MCCASRFQHSPYFTRFLFSTGCICFRDVGFTSHCWICHALQPCSSSISVYFQVPGPRKFDFAEYPFDRPNWSGYRFGRTNVIVSFLRRKSIESSEFDQTPMKIQASLQPVTRRLFSYRDAARDAASVNPAGRRLHRPASRARFSLSLVAETMLPVWVGFGRRIQVWMPSLGAD